MTKTVTIDELRESLEQIVEQVSSESDELVVERDGKATAQSIIVRAPRKPGPK